VSHQEWLTQLFQQYGKKAVIVAVYIAEAHARDEWPVGDTISCCNQPKTTSERVEIARSFVSLPSSSKVPMLIDNAETNEFHLKMGAWPFRFYVFKQNKLVLKAQPNPLNGSYRVEDLEEWLKENVK